MQGIAAADASLNAEQHAEFLQLMRCLLEPDPTLRGHPHDRAEGVLNGIEVTLLRESDSQSSSAG